MKRRDRDEFVAPAPHFATPVEPSGRPALSVVVPLFEEEALVPVLVARLTRVLDALAPDGSEVILVDDGSRDGTFAAVARAHAADPRFVGLALSRNFGQQVAISAGLAHTRGEAVVVMDGDLQDPPEAIGPLWARLREGFDVVYAIRASRPEGPLKRLFYRAFYRLLERLGAIDIPRDAGDFGIMTRRVVDLLNAMPERRRFVRGLRAWVGLRQAGLAIDRGPRHSGRPKFTPTKLVALALDGLVGFSDAPLRWPGVVGSGLFALSGLILIGVVATTAGAVPGWLWAVLAVGFSTSVQLLFLTILGEYLGRTLQEVQGRPLYVVRRRLGLGPPRRRSRRRAVDAGRTRT